MKPTPSYPPDPLPVLAFGAHPDDIEFGCGARVCIRGEVAPKTLRQVIELLR